MNVSSLYSPCFWKAFIAQMVPLDDAMEERMLTSLAIRAGLSPSHVRERMEAYLRGRMAELHGEAHPGTDTIESAPWSIGGSILSAPNRSARSQSNAVACGRCYRISFMPETAG
jgi:hypothetical protein